MKNHNEKVFVSLLCVSVCSNFLNIRNTIYVKLKTTDRNVSLYVTLSFSKFKIKDFKNILEDLRHKYKFNIVKPFIFSFFFKFHLQINFIYIL